MGGRYIGGNESLRKWCGKNDVRGQKGRVGTSYYLSIEISTLSRCIGVASVGVVGEHFAQVLEILGPVLDGQGFRHLGSGGSGRSRGGGGSRDRVHGVGDGRRGGGGIVLLIVRVRHVQRCG